MKRLVAVILMFGFMSSVCYAQVLTNDDIKYVKAIRLIKETKKQIEIKLQEKEAAVALARKPFDIEISTLSSNMETAAQSIGLSLDDFND